MAEARSSKMTCAQDVFSLLMNGCTDEIQSENSDDSDDGPVKDNIPGFFDGNGILTVPGFGNVEVPDVEIVFQNGSDTNHENELGINSADQPASENISSNAADPEAITDAQNKDPDYIPSNDENSADSLTEMGNDKEPPLKKRKRPRTKKGQTDQSKEKHPMLPPCPNKCRNKCTAYFSAEDRQAIHGAFWRLDYDTRRAWLSGQIEKRPVQRRRPTVSENDDTAAVRSCSLIYSMTNGSQEKFKVCQKFFLATLGYTSNKVILKMQQALPQDSAPVAPKPDQRGNHEPHNKKDDKIIEEHILSFKPQISHYRREHAPNRRYLPCDLNLTIMFNQFIEEQPGFCSYETYRKVFLRLNIGFGSPTADICDDCAYYKANVEANPELQAEWDAHIQFARDARRAYENDRDSNDWEETTKVYAVDLQKVLLLPMMGGLKSAIFTPRLVVFNETFADMKFSEKKEKREEKEQQDKTKSQKKEKMPKKKKKNYIVLWHEAIAGRSKENLACTYSAVISEERDAKQFVFWVDNCSGQNKNWCLFTAFIIIVNEDDGPEEIRIRYLVPGHTFMAADSIHGQIEKKIRKEKTICDYRDLARVMTEATEGNALKSLNVNDFMEWPDHCVARTTKAGKLLPYLHDIVEVKFVKGSTDLCYKTSYNQEEFVSCSFMKKKAKLERPQAQQVARGVSSKKKAEIISKLVTKMDVSRRAFWTTLPENKDSADLLDTR